MSDAFVNPERVARVAAALEQRLGSVVAVCEALNRRHNVSAVLRSCEAFGIHEVHLVTPSFRPAYGTARGAERWVVRHRFEHVADSFVALRARGFRVYAADLDAAAYTPETVPVDTPVAVVFGSEMLGVSAEARAACDGVIRVPMVGLTGSLNVSVSAAIILRALAERRRALVGPDLSSEEKARFLREWLEAEERAARGEAARTAAVAAASGAHRET